MNGLPAGEFEIDRFGGHVMLENRKGHVQIRNVTLQAAEPLSSAFDAPGVQRPTGWAMQSPEIIEEVKALYAPEATQRRIEGIVGLEAVVLPDGSVGSVRVTQPLDPALDASAIAALKGWRFKAGTRGGVPVPVLVSVQITFTLRGREDRRQPKPATGHVVAMCTRKLLTSGEKGEQAPDECITPHPDRHQHESADHPEDKKGPLDAASRSIRAFHRSSLRSSIDATLKESVLEHADLGRSVCGMAASGW